MYKVGESTRKSRFECEECGLGIWLRAPDYVVLEYPNTVRCRVCGVSYQWQVPVPIGLFVGGNEAFGWEHLGCDEYRRELRGDLVSLLKRRLRVLLYAEGLLADFEREHGPICTTLESIERTDAAAAGAFENDENIHARGDVTAEPPPHADAPRASPSDE